MTERRSNRMAERGGLAGVLVRSDISLTTR
jgi:hypothetical protein